MYINMKYVLATSTECTRISHSCISLKSRKRLAKNMHKACHKQPSSPSLSFRSTPRTTFSCWHCQCHLHCIKLSYEICSCLLWAACNNFLTLTSHLFPLHNNILWCASTSLHCVLISRHHLQPGIVHECTLWDCSAKLDEQMATWWDEESSRVELPRGSFIFLLRLRQQQTRHQFDFNA